MTQHFDFIVVGKGMMGASAARHLAITGASVALVGPDEPQDRKAHDGVYASHYDSGRITRTIDGDIVWARLANRSIARYRAVEAESGISFYQEAGCLITGPVPKGEGTFLDGVVDVADRLHLDAPLAQGAQIAARFPWFRIADGAAGLFEATGAGHIDPRAFVAAQTACTEKAGGTIVRDEAVSIESSGERVTVGLRSDASLTAGRVLLAAGGFSAAPGLLSRSPDLVVRARTVLLAEIAEADVSGFAGMPCWIDESGTPSDHFYMLPPIRYPDGRYYLKIGGDRVDIELSDQAAIRRWFGTDGDAGAISHLKRVLASAVPGLRPVSLASLPCITTYTVHGYPYAGFVEGERVALLSGGNGAAAKSSDEIGRIGADLLVRGRLDEPDYETDFAVHFR